MAKSIKLTKERYWSDTSITHGSTNLNGIITRLTSQKVLIGIYPILSTNYSGSYQGEQTIFKCYSFKDQLLAEFPLKDGYTRTYVAQTTLNTGGTSIILKLGGQEIMPQRNVWGENTNMAMSVIYKECTTEINNIGGGNTSLTAWSENNTWFKINSVNLLVYDTPNNL